MFNHRDIPHFNHLHKNLAYGYGNEGVYYGDVVSFMYKGQQDDSKSARRIVICLDPRYEHRKKTTNRIVDYFVGLEIFNSQKSQIFKRKFTFWNSANMFRRTRKKTFI